LALIRRLLEERPTYGSRRIRRGRAHPVHAPYTEHVPPDVTAAIFWLKNRASTVMQRVPRRRLRR
jgi:hypothetical protein